MQKNLSNSLNDFGAIFKVQQLEIFREGRSPHRPKPQISSIPGTSPKQRDRYRVVLGDQILGDRLTIDQALALAKRGRA